MTAWARKSELRCSSTVYHVQSRSTNVGETIVFLLHIRADFQQEKSKGVTKHNIQCKRKKEAVNDKINKYNYHQNENVIKYVTAADLPALLEI